MRVGVVAFLLAVALFAVVVTVGTIGSVFSGGAGVHTVSCDAAIGPLPDGGGAGAADVRHLTAEQRGHAAATGLAGRHPGRDDRVGAAQP